MEAVQFWTQCSLHWLRTHDFVSTTLHCACSILKSPLLWVLSHQAFLAPTFYTISPINYTQSCYHLWFSQGCEAMWTLEGPSINLFFSKFAQFQSLLPFHLQNHCSSKLLLMMWHIPQVLTKIEHICKPLIKCPETKKITLQLSDRGKSGEGSNCGTLAIAVLPLDKASTLWNYWDWCTVRRFWTGRYFEIIGVSSSQAESSCLGTVNLFVTWVPLPVVP